MEASFRKLTVVLSNNVLLNVPQSGDSYSLHTDACGTGIGAVLNVKRSGLELTVAFFSRQLRPAEKNYTITELETLAIVTSVEHFLLYLWGNSFDVVTDHRQCTYLLHNANLNKRLRRFMLNLQQYDMNIIY